MDRMSRVVLGFHGCEPGLADALIRGELPITAWNASRNVYDWLGEGIYFWEHAPKRALEWGEKGGVIGAVIQLGLCLDLTDVRLTDLLSAEYETVQRTHEELGRPLPENKGKRRDLDCLVINSLVDSMKAKGQTFQTVRGVFLEGDPVFPGSGILRESHIQIAVRVLSCIVGVFRPNLSQEEQ
jgi:hypothetical protein